MTVIDWTEGVAGPYACQVLADLGAEVIKVEQPNGDWGRSMGSYTGEVNPSFVALNRNKRGICLQVKGQEGLKIAHSLIKKADILVSSYRPGVMERLGLSYDEVIKINPDLIYGRVSAYGNVGDLADQPGSDTILQANSGFMSQIGEASSAPYRSGIPVIDLVAARDLVMGIQASVISKLKGETNNGLVDVNLFASAAALQTQFWQQYFSTGEVRTRNGNRNPSLAPAGIYETKDKKYLSIAILKEEHWLKFCRALEIENIHKNPLYSNNNLRLANREQLEAELIPVFKSHNQACLLQILRECDVLVAPVLEYDEIANNIDLMAAIPKANLPSGDSLAHGVAVGLPITFNNTNLRVTKYSSPYKGEHTQEILLELGYEVSEIEDFIATGIVFKKHCLRKDEYQAYENSIKP